MPLTKPKSVKSTEIIMGMPITVEIINGNNKDLKKVFDYFKYVDSKYSPFKSNSEVSLINSGLPNKNWSDEMKEVLKLCDETKKETNGYFDVYRYGKLDPSGLVKGWAINNAAKLLSDQGYGNYYIEAGGDIQVSGKNLENLPWIVGVRNPFNINQIIKVVAVSDRGVATSGTYIRGQHIYNPKSNKEVDEVISLTIIGPNIYEADRIATGAFAMGRKGIEFIEQLKGFEGYMVDNDKIATFTSGFEKYVIQNS